MRALALLTLALMAPALAGAPGAIAKAESFTPSQSTITGNPRGKVTIVELIDYRCPYCVQMHQTLTETLEMENDVALSFVPLPWSSEESATLAAMVLAAQKQGKDDKLHQALLAQGEPQSIAAAKELARGLGIDMAKLETDMQSPGLKAQIVDNLRYAISLNLKTTPGLLINGKLFNPSKDEMPGVNQLRLLIDEAGR